MTLNSLSDKKIIKEALNNWYGQKQKNYDKWSKQYQIEIKTNYDDLLVRQEEWCKKAKIIVTPTILLNGYRLPDLYQLLDLKYMLQ